jgi:hypothetical protein
MSWKRIVTVETVGIAYDAAMVSGKPVFRGAQNVFGWQKDSKELAWVHPLPGDELFGMKRLFALPDSAVTLSDTHLDQPKSVVWLDPSTGAIKQERSYSINTSQQGFTATGDLLFLHGRTPENRWVLLRISAKTGEVLEQADAPSGVDICASSKRLYLSQQAEALFHTSVEAVQWTRADLEGAAGPFIWNDELFFSIVPADENPSWELAWWHANKARPAGRVRMEVAQALDVKPSPQAGVIAAHDAKRGLWVVDFEAATCRWSLPPERGERLSGVCWTPHGLVTAIKHAAGAARLENRDPATGKVLETLPGTRYDISRLYWLEDRLIASGLDGLESFAWDE